MYDETLQHIIHNKYLEGASKQDKSDSKTSKHYTEPEMVSCTESAVAKINSKLCLHIKDPRTRRQGRTCNTMYATPLRQGLERETRFCGLLSLCGKGRYVVEFSGMQRKMEDSDRNNIANHSIVCALTMLRH